MQLTRVTALSCLFLSAIPGAAIGANTDSGGYEVIANAFGFGIDIPGCADASKNIREISIDDLTIDIREQVSSSTDYRLYGPGQAHWGQARLASAVKPGTKGELGAWLEETKAGKNIRKNITVTLFKSDKSPGRSYLLMDCVPTYGEESKDEQNNEPVEWIYVRPLTGIRPVQGSSSRQASARAEATTSDKFAQVRGFKVDIANAGGKEVDTAWESVSGGEMIIELTETTIGADKFQTNSPGHKSVGEITLRGAITDKRAALCTWINDTVDGKEWRRSFAITELLGPGAGAGSTKSYNYHDCFPVRYVFPRLSVYNQRGSVQESVTLKTSRSRTFPSRTVGLFQLEGAPVASAGAVAIALDDRALDRDMLSQSNNLRAPVVTLLLKPGTGGEMQEWLKKVLAGKTDRKSGSIVLHDREHNERIGRIILHDCIIVSHAASIKNTTGNTMEEVAIKPIRVELK